MKNSFLYRPRKWMKRQQQHFHPGQDFLLHFSCYALRSFYKNYELAINNYTASTAPDSGSLAVVALSRNSKTKIMRTAVAIPAGTIHMLFQFTMLFTVK